MAEVLAAAAFAFCAGLGLGAAIVAYINARWWEQEAQQRKESAGAVRALPRQRREAPAGTSVERQAEMWRTGQLDA